MSAADGLEGVTSNCWPTQLCLRVRWDAVPGILEEGDCVCMMQGEQEQSWGLCLSLEN